MKDLVIYDNALEALDFAVQNSVDCPYRCLVKGALDVVFEAEITISTHGYCLSAVEPGKLYEDLKWKEYQQTSRKEVKPNA